MTRGDFDAKAASARAVEVRRERASLKQELSLSQRDFLETFDLATERVDPIAAGLRVDWFLRCLPAVGPTKALRILERLGINPRATLGGLRINQRTAFRRELVSLVGKHAPSRGNGPLIIIAGPTAVGKATVLAQVRQIRPEFVMSVSATTRARRPGERNGVDYFFVSEEEFDRLVARGELLEWATVHGRHRYGTPRGPVREQQRGGHTVLLEIDLQGARQIRESGEEALFIFIAPPTFNALVERLESRGTEDDEERQRRLATAVEELSAKEEFDAVVVNDQVDQAARDVVDLITRYRRQRGES